jgi:hypothetical protein
VSYQQNKLLHSQFQKGKPFPQDYLFKSIVLSQYRPTIFITFLVWFYLTSVENIQRNRIVYKIESEAFRSLFKGDSQLIKKLCDSIKRSSTIFRHLDGSILDILCSDEDLTVSSKFSTKDIKESNLKSLFWFLSFFLFFFLSFFLFFIKNT